MDSKNSLVFSLYIFFLYLPLMLHAPICYYIRIFDIIFHSLFLSVLNFFFHFSFPSYFLSSFLPSLFIPPPPPPALEKVLFALKICPPVHFIDFLISAKSHLWHALTDSCGMPLLTAVACPYWQLWHALTDSCGMHLLTAVACTLLTAVACTKVTISSCNLLEIFARTLFAIALKNWILLKFYFLV